MEPSGLGHSDGCSVVPLWSTTDEFCCFSGRSSEREVNVRGRVSSGTLVGVGVSVPIGKYELCSLSCCVGELGETGIECFLCEGFLDERVGLGCEDSVVSLFSLTPMPIPASSSSKVRGWWRRLLP